MRYGDLFTGFGGATIGAMAAGLTPLWGIELDPVIAAVANENLGGHVMVTNILDVDPATLPKVDVLHASPPCPNFSIAKVGGKETELDIALAKKVAEFIRVIDPMIFTLENVYAYRHSKSWNIINDALYELGYWVSAEKVNAADYGVPQSRKRMIVRAVRGGWVPYLPEPESWVGWYEAIEDLIPTLPDSQFAPWQLKRLPDELRTMLLAHGAHGGKVVNVCEEEPAFTVTSNSNQTNIKAVLVGGANTSEDQAAEGVGLSEMSEPSRCVNASNSQHWRGLLIPGDNSSNGTIRYADEPMVTLQTRAPGQCTHRAYTGYRVVSMTPRCLARFQSFPDSYMLPKSKTLAAKGIGNAVPPLLYQKIIRQLVREV